MSRFSQLYIERTEALQDSPRMRKRISSYFEKFIQEKYNSTQRKTLGEIITGAIPIRFGVDVYDNYNTLGQFLENCELRDFLDCLTLIYQVSSAYNAPMANNFIKFCESVFREENTVYTIDENGIAHYFTDKEFEENIASSIAILSDKKLSAVRKHFESSHQALTQIEPNTRVAVREIFEAIETLAKHIDPKITALAANDINGSLKKAIAPYYPEKTSQAPFLNQMMSSLAAYVTAHQPYRHGQAAPEPPSPPIEFATWSLSAGASFIRFLAEAHSKIEADKSKAPAQPSNQNTASPE